MCVGMGHEGARTEIHMAFLAGKFEGKDMIYFVNCNWVDTRWQ